MIYEKNKQLGFSAIELMITLFIAVAFFTAGYQIYSLITTDGDQARTQARANNALNEYLQRYKPLNTDICVNNTPVNNQSIAVSGLINVTVNVTITCSSVNEINTSKETVTVNYNIPQKSITNSVSVNTKPMTCPAGFIKVPGSKTYNTNDFCVMKYEAKADDNGDGVGDTNQTTGVNTWPANTYPISTSRKLTSSAAGYPVANISQTTAITAASSFVYGCDSGCHLITEAEWMTIAQNVLSVASNWSSGTVGSGYIFSGHNDNVPATGLVADLNDLNGYIGTGQSSPSNQKRTLTLTNGEVIWDFAGNMYEWTTEQKTGGQPTGMTAAAWYDWTAVSGGTFNINPYPSGTMISGSSLWNNTNGIGQIYGLTTDSVVRGLTRSGNWNDNNRAGILLLSYNAAPSATGVSLGLRAAK